MSSESMPTPMPMLFPVIVLPVIVALVPVQKYVVAKMAADFDPSDKAVPRQLVMVLLPVIVASEPPSTVIA